MVDAVGELPVELVLSGDEALVLFDWLARFNKNSNDAVVSDPAEAQVLWDLECSLERVLVSPLKENYEEVLQRARRKVRDRLGS